jgi:hypothetical protein
MEKDDKGESFPSRKPTYFFTSFTSKLEILCLLPEGTQLPLARYFAYSELYSSSSYQELPSSWTIKRDIRHGQLVLPLILKHNVNQDKILLKTLIGITPFLNVSPPDQSVSNLHVF